MESRKKLLAQYKEREIIGGVYVIKNTLNNKMLLDAAIDLKGSHSRFAFSQKTGSCLYLKLQKDWEKQGGGEFVFEVLEELKKAETQTTEEFKADIDVLKEIWLGKLAGKDLY